MEDTAENKPIRYKKHMSVGILAHVDAGKTTLSEALLYLSGSIRKIGRVDHGDAFLDTYALERSRGITIFSKQAVFDLGDKRVTLLDTPGHVDFSAEMERTLGVLDYAVLVVSGADGVQGHTGTLWNLLKRYNVPTFLFVNKMDQEGVEAEKVLQQLQRRLSGSCVGFSAAPCRNGSLSEEELRGFYEELSVCDEEALEEYLETDRLSQGTIVRLIAERKAFPCYFGSALKMQGVQGLLDGLEYYTGNADMKEEGGSADDLFGARVYKISRDGQGNRLTHLKVTAGVLKVKDAVSGESPEKVNQIRVYSGEKYEAVSSAEKGMICAVTGLACTYPGQGLGTEKDLISPALEPVLDYRVILPEGCDAHVMVGNLKQLEEEDPMLRVAWDEELKEIQLRLMGEVQIEILRSLIEERFGTIVSFDTGNIVYKETIRNIVEGIGHYEPLRHYAEAHLILEPGEAGSGVAVGTDCSEDMLDRNWQRLILTHLKEKAHRGVLTGATLTDVKITLVAGRAHLKHTEGGDFRQSAYRAVRQGLMQAESILLEPYYDFILEVPPECVGRALTDIQRMHGSFAPPGTEGETAIITGTVPVASVRDYQTEVAGYTKGRGHLSCSFRGYAPCHNAKEVIETVGYDPEADLDNPTGSIFCSHGAGFYVPWNEVPEYMHIESQLEKRRRQEEETSAQAGKNPAGRMRKDGLSGNPAGAGKVRTAWSPKEEKELEEIFIRTYGKIERKPIGGRTSVTEEKVKGYEKEEHLNEYLLVDGYNVIFAWEDLKELAKVNIEAARNRLMDVLSNYQGFKKCRVILVFDAYKVEGCALEIQKYHNIHVVYTKEAETADQYIEKVVHEIGRKYHVAVVTSDSVEQVVTLGQGGTLISAREFEEEVEIVRSQIRAEAEKRRESGKNYLFDYMDRELAKEMEEVRLGRKEMS